MFAFWPSGESLKTLQVIDDNIYDRDVGDDDDNIVYDDDAAAADDGDDDRLP